MPRHSVIYNKFTQILTENFESYSKCMQKEPGKSTVFLARYTGGVLVAREYINSACTQWEQDAFQDFSARTLFALFEEGRTQLFGEKQQEKSENYIECD